MRVQQSKGHHVDKASQRPAGTDQPVRDRSVQAYDQLPDLIVARAIAYQVSKSASSRAANYREARRARSRREFISKIGVAIQETEETRFWLESILDIFADIHASTLPLLKESSELIAIYTASVKTACRNCQS